MIALRSVVGRDALPGVSTVVVTGFALALYALTTTPGFTWAHQGADGGELLAAAVTNGVPHPPGYPLYTLLLQGWLAVTGLLWPSADLAWRGNLFSVLCATLSAAVTTLALLTVLPARPGRWLWALGAGLAWVISPLPWSQAVITEVYALHSLLIALLGWATFQAPRHPWRLVIIIGLGLAHHLTFVLLLPAVFYYWWLGQGGGWQRAGQLLLYLGGGAVLGVLFYGRIPLVLRQTPPAPVNWGYATNWADFWWLISANAYRTYLFSAPASTILSRVANWAFTLTSQLTPVGLGLALIGLSVWDQLRPQLRNFSLLWVTPISIYTVGYYTRDSDIYLLPVVWLTMIWLAIGLDECATWLKARWPQVNFGAVLAGLLLIGCGGLLLVRLPQIAVRQDGEAQAYLRTVIETVEPDSLIITSEDKDTFAIWYSAWGSGDLLRSRPDVAIINHSLCQFSWYQRLISELYPDVVQNQTTAAQIVAVNRGRRPIYFTEQVNFVPTEQLEAVGPLWRYRE